MRNSARIFGILIVSAVASILTVTGTAEAGGLKERVVGKAGADKLNPDTGRTQGNRKSGTTLTFWWWGEQEAPGLAEWLEETIGLFEAENPGVRVEAILQPTESLVDNFVSACAAGTPPDIVSLWGGLYLQIQVWRGWLEPLDDLIPKETLKDLPGGGLSYHKGRQYSAGWYLEPYGILYNKRLFSEAGIPDTGIVFPGFEDFLEGCGLLKKRGIIPMAAGFADGFWGEWYLSAAFSASAISLDEIGKLAAGLSDFGSGPGYDLWVGLDEMIRAEYVNGDAAGLDMFQGFELFTTGRAAMVPAPLRLLPAAVQALGAQNLGAQALGKEAVGIMNWPAMGKGPVGGLPVVGIQGLSVPAKSKRKKEAARFILFMHGPERLSSLYEIAKVLPAHAGWDGAAKMGDPLQRLQWSWFEGAHFPDVGDLFPREFHEKISGVAPIMLANSASTTLDISRMADEVTATWLKENPELARAYGRWVNEGMGKE